MRHILPLLLSLYYLAGCAGATYISQLEAPAAQVIEEGLIDCFPESSQRRDKPYFCEASAVTRLDHHLLILSDKPLPSGSPAFTVSLDGIQPMPSSAQTISVEAIRSAAKFEAIAQTNDQRYVIASTAFDRFSLDNPQWDAYNTLVFWPSQYPEQAKTLNAINRQGTVSSLPIRQALENHLKTPYFKIEGLAVLENKRLLFGVRETGNSHQDFNYRILIIEAALEISAQGLSITPVFSTLLDFTVPGDLNLEKDLGISGIETSPDGHTLYFLTSHEAGEELGAYLWSWDSAQSRLPPALVRTTSRQALHFPHKAEGLTFLDAKHLLLIHDDDRKIGGKPFRNPHQAPYSIIKLLGNLD